MLQQITRTCSKIARTCRKIKTRLDVSCPWQSQKIGAGPSVRWPTLLCSSSPPHLQCQIAGTSDIGGRGAVGGQVRDCGGEDLLLFVLGTIPSGSVFGETFANVDWSMVGRRHCLLLLMCLLWVIFVCSCCFDAWWFIVVEENDTKIYCLHLWIRTKQNIGAWVPWSHHKPLFIIQLNPNLVSLPNWLQELPQLVLPWHVLLVPS
jgi:hypothetical protein